MALIAMLIGSIGVFAILIRRPAHSAKRHSESD